MKYEYVYGEDISGEYGDITVGIERITPEVAEKMLDTNIVNRAMPKEPIEEALLVGEWALNGESIIFSNEGALLDGQTRLSACVNTGIPIEAVVVRGIDPKAQLVMDCGTSRTLPAHLKMLGVKNYDSVGAIAKKLYRCDRWGLESALSGSHDKVTIKTLINYALDNHAEIQDLITQVRASRHEHRSLGIGELGVLAREFNRVDREDSDEFFAQLSMRSTPSQPVSVLIKRLNEDARSVTGKLPKRTLGALVIKAWNFYLNGTEATPDSLRFRAGGKAKEKFPEIAHY